MKLIPLAITVIALSLAGCSGKDSKTASVDTYEKGKRTIEEVEKEDPVRFLSVSGKDKKNLLGQTVIKGSIRSNAKMISYKDIDVKLSFYSKTGVLLEEDHEMIYETVAPGGEVDFKSKYFAPKGSDSVAMKITDAGVVEKK